MMVRRFEPAYQLKVIGIKHVVYEYANLLSAAHYSLRGAAPWRTHCDNAFLLGCRKIGDSSMENKRSTKGGDQINDVLALDYLLRQPNPGDLIRTWDLPIWIGELREAMNKQLAHIAYKRDKEWDHRKWVPRLEDRRRHAMGKPFMSDFQRKAERSK
jgi:hypothetical protein